MKAILKYFEINLRTHNVSRDELPHWNGCKSQSHEESGWKRLACPSPAVRSVGRTIHCQTGKDAHFLLRLLQEAGQASQRWSSSASQPGTSNRVINKWE